MNRKRNRFPGLFTWRGALYRLLAVVISLSPLLAFELICIWCGWGEPDYQEDPFAGFSSVRPPERTPPWFSMIWRTMARSRSLPARSPWVMKGSKAEIRTAVEHQNV